MNLILFRQLYLQVEQINAPQICMSAKRSPKVRKVLTKENKAKSGSDVKNRTFLFPKHYFLMKNILFSISLLILTNIAFAQSAPQDTIFMKKNLGTNIYYRNGNVINFITLQGMFDKNTESYNLMKKAKVHYGVAFVAAFTGGMFLGYSLGQKLTSKPVNTQMLLAGVGLIGVSIPFNMMYNKKSLKAVRLYNQSRL